MGALVKPPTITTDPGAPAIPAALPVYFHLFATPSPNGTAYRHKNGFPNSPDDFTKWSQLDADPPAGWYLPIAYMTFVRFDGVPVAPNGYPLVAGPVVGWFDVNTPTGRERVYRTYHKNGPHGVFTPYGSSFVDPPHCETGGPCGVVMQSNFAGRPAIPARPEVTTTDLHEGWNAGANSVTELDTDLHVVFHAAIAAAGVCGLAAPPRSDVTRLDNLAHAFYFDRDPANNSKRVSVMEYGLIRRMVGTYAEADEFEISRVVGIVSYKIAGVGVYVSTSLSSGSLLVGTALYRARDEITDAAFVSLGGTATSQSGSGTAHLRLRASGREIAVTPGNGYGRASIGPMRVASVGTSPPTPAYAAGRALLYLAAAGTGRLSFGGSGGAQLRLRARGSALTAHGTGGLELTIRARGSESGVVEPPPPDFDVVYAAVRVAIDAAQQNTPVAVLIEGLSLRGSQQSRFEGIRTVTESLVFEDALAGILYVLVSEGVAFNAPVSEQREAIARCVERLLLDGSVSSLADAIETIIIGLVFGTLSSAPPIGSGTDTIAVNALVANTVEAVAKALEGLVLETSGSNVLTATVIVSESVAISPTPSTAADFLSVVRDGIGFVTRLTLDSGEYIAWVLNTESKALSRYTQFPFNSFAKIGATYFGAASDGLHRMQGDTDNGEEIRARIRVGLSDLGTRKLKRLPEVFMSARHSSASTVYLKVITVGEDGEKAMCIYKMRERPASVMRENRIQIGRGLKSIDWDFELELVNDPDFDLKKMEFRPLVLDRRTRG